MGWPKNNLLQNCSEGVWPPHVIREKDHCHGSRLHFFWVLRFLKQRLDRFAQFSVLKCHLSILPIDNRQHLCCKDHLMWDQDTSKTRCTETTTSPRPRQTMLRPSPSKTETELRPRLKKGVRNDRVQPSSWIVQRPCTRTSLPVDHYVVSVMSETKTWRSSALTGRERERCTF